MTWPPSVSVDHGGVENGVNQAVRNVPGQTGGGRVPGAGSDPRLTAAVDDSRRSGDRTRRRVKDEGDRSSTNSRRQADAQSRARDSVSNTGSGGSGSGKPSGSGGGAGGGSQQPSMPQVSMPQQPQQPQMTPQMSSPPQTQAPGGVTSIPPELLAKLILAARQKSREEADRGESSTTSRSTTSTTSGQGAASTPQSPEKLDVKDVSLEKYAGGVLSKEQVADVIDQALTINGIPNDPSIREQWQELYQYMAEKESSNNPNAGNNSDSNAVGEIMEDGYRANSSRGIWQCIPSTFAAYHMGGTSNSIYDPVASASASINYVIQTYGLDKSGGQSVADFYAARGGGGDSYRGY